MPPQYGIFGQMATNGAGGSIPPLTKNRDRRHDLRDKRGTFVSRREQRADEVRPVLCRVCGQGLLTHAERLIGVHIGCVSDRKYRGRIAPRGPTYGFRKSDR